MTFFNEMGTQKKDLKSIFVAADVQTGFSTSLRQLSPSLRKFYYSLPLLRLFRALHLSVTLTVRTYDVCVLKCHSNICTLFYPFPSYFHPSLFPISVWG